MNPFLYLVRMLMRLTHSPKKTMNTLAIHLVFISVVEMYACTEKNAVFNKHDQFLGM